MEFDGKIEGISLLPLSDIEADTETIRDMCAAYTEFESVGLEGLFKQLSTGGTYEI